MLTSLQQKRAVRDQRGFTLIELLVVMVIIGILLAIAVPSYLGFKARANRSAAKANVRSALSSIEAYFSDYDSYAGLTVTKLRTSYDAGVALTTIKNASPSQYCAQAVSGSAIAHRTGPSGALTLTGSC